MKKVFLFMPVKKKLHHLYIKNFLPLAFILFSQLKKIGSNSKLVSLKHLPAASLQIYKNATVL
jgi:hypothetical protein